MELIDTKPDHTELTRLHKQDIRTQVFNQLVDQIQRGVWKSGTKIPSENELSDVFGVSRISVREAIQKLNAFGLVETFRGKGTFVKELSGNTYFHSLLPMVSLTKHEILNVLEFRKIVEVGIVDHLIEKVTDRDIAALTKLLQKMIKYQDNLETYTKFDLDFHIKLYEMTGNPFILKVTNMTLEILQSSILGTISPQGVQEGIVFHTALLAAIERRNAEEVKKITDELLTQVIKEVKETL